MSLYAYALATPTDPLHVWVGVYGVDAAPKLGFAIDDQPVQPVFAKPLQRIRDGAGGGSSFCGVVAFAGLQPGVRHRISVTASGETCELSTARVRTALPHTLEDAFHVLLVSCYSQPEDEDGSVSRIVSQIQVRPDLVLFLGDQVYLDLPLFEDLPEEAASMAATLGDKYRRNWAQAHLGVAGLSGALARAPIACVADDHEFWNNYPFRQKHLPNTWNEAVRNRWRDAALALYEDYQLPAHVQPGGIQRIDVAPLSFLMLDSRSLRDSDFNRLAPDAVFNQVVAWVDELIGAKANGTPRYGVLISGQALFVKAPTSDSERRNVDAELANFAQFAALLAQIERLTDAGVPLLYVTGDVHWGRVASAIDRVSGHMALYEVICSPSRLIRVPVMDSFRDTANSVRGLFGQRATWPRHSDAAPVIDWFGTNGRYLPKSEPNDQGATGHKGDQVAVLSFARAGAGVDFDVRYYGVHAEVAAAKSRRFGPYKLRVW
jgi:hypothetical protein